MEVEQQLQEKHRHHAALKRKACPSRKILA
jgi:hypothetical protein